MNGEDAPVLKIATDYDFCPNSYINKEGDLSGLYIEVMTEAVNRLGMKPVFETSNWMGCRKMLTDGDVDVLPGREIFSNMEGTLRTIPVCSDELRVYGKKKIDSAAALAGKKVALMARSVIETTYDLQCKYVEYTINTEILEAVENGEADYGICHGAVATKIIEKNDFHLVSGLSIAKSYPALAVRDDQSELRDNLNNTLQEMSLDGTIGHLQDKWITEFTRNTSLSYVLKHNAIFYVTFIISIIVLLVIVIAFRVVYDYQEKYINTLLEYQEKLKRSNEETQQANRAKSEFLSHMSHDIQHPYLLGSPAHLRRILLNLISKALRYNKPEGSIDVYISELNSDDRYALFELKVQDTGIGMSREFLEKSLFKPFTQEDDRVRTEYYGTGLGMSIVKELVTGMNSTIQAESEPGKGTTFTIRLSLKINHDAIQQQNVLEKQSHDISGMRLLVAEDNQLNLEIILCMLELEGAEVVSVQNGQEAVEEFEASAPGTYDAILMDIMMPVMDGLEAARKIRGLYRKDAGTIPIIARYKKI